mmetsp:Transcript_96497/g.191198  ORF Transcript_96497/g.191198 Transcript_96497/m.191198 type:complete len:112 (+) Transcript_96497:2-337(+)
MPLKELLPQKRHPRLRCLFHAFGPLLLALGCIFTARALNSKSRLVEFHPFEELPAWRRSLLVRAHLGMAVLTVLKGAVVLSELYQLPAMCIVMISPVASRTEQPSTSHAIR